MGLWNVLIGGVAAWVFGVVWYRAFGPRRVVLTGGTGQPVGLSPMIVLASLGVMIVATGFLRHIFWVSALTSGIGLGLVAGMGVGMFFVGPWLWITNLADRRPFKLTLIDGGYATLATAIMGALLVAF